MNWRIPLRAAQAAARAQAECGQHTRQCAAAAVHHYGPQMDAMFAVTESEERSGMPVERVSDAIAEALTSPKPRSNYLVGLQARGGSILALMPAAFRERAIRKSMRLP